MIQKFKKLSIKKQIIVFFSCLSLILVGIAFFVLLFNNTVLKNNSRYLTYISNIDTIYQIQAQNKELLYQIREGTSESKALLDANIQQTNSYLDELEKGFTTRDIKLRVHTVRYLLKSFESRTKEMIWMRDYESHTESDSADTGNVQSASFLIYQQTLNISDRINTYLQDILHYSVDENQEFIHKSVKNSHLIQIFTLSFIIALFLVSIIFYLVLAGYVSKLIKSIMMATKHITEGNQEAKIIMLDGPKEMQELAIQFNDLLKTLYQLNNESKRRSELEMRLIEEEKNQADLKLLLTKEELEQLKVRDKLKEAQLHGLQMQIQPHFLFNTLNMISMTALLENANKAYELLLALSKFMRRYLRKANQNVLIEEEIDMITQYLTILKARMGEQLDYQVIVSGQPSQVRIPMFTLQPIVENAFQHGIENMVKKGKIVVRVKEQNDVLSISIFNNGLGMKHEELKELREKLVKTREDYLGDEKIGMANVAYRLYQLFEGSVKFLINSSDSRGTIISIQIKLTGQIGE